MNQTQNELPQEYIYWLVQWQEDNFSIPELTEFQWHMLGWVLKSWVITPFPVEESKRLEAVKRERLWCFRAHEYSSIPLREIWSAKEVDRILWNLDLIWANSSIFERYTTQEFDPRELMLDTSLFRRLWISAYKNRLLWILDWSISGSISPKILIELTINKLKALWCTEKYLEDFINNSKI